MSYKKREKKSDTLEVRLPHSKKEAFKSACEAEGITVSEAVRTFVDAYIRRSRRVKLKTITQDLTMTMIRNPLKTTGGFAATVAAIAAAFSVFALPSAADDVYREPVAPPAPKYPAELASAGVSANCEAKFDIAPSGLITSEIKVDCTHPGFVDATRNAVQSLVFEPEIVDGKAVAVKGVVYPIQYLITSDSENIKGPAPAPKDG